MTHTYYDCLHIVMCFILESDALSKVNFVQSNQICSPAATCTALEAACMHGCVAQGTCQDEGAHTGDEARQKAVEGEGPHQHTVQELQGPGQQDVQ